MLWLRQQNAMGTVPLMGFTCVARPDGDSALSHAGLLCCAVSKICPLVALLYFSAEELHLIPHLLFSLVKMSHLPSEVGMYHNPEI